jgi:hypothetical protein
MEDQNKPLPSDDESLNDLKERAAKIKSEGKKTIEKLKQIQEETTHLLEKKEKPGN